MSTNKPPKYQVKTSDDGRPLVLVDGLWLYIDSLVDVYFNRPSGDADAGAPAPGSPSQNAGAPAPGSPSQNAGAPAIPSSSPYSDENLRMRGLLATIEDEWKVVEEALGDLDKPEMSLPDATVAAINLLHGTLRDKAELEEAVRRLEARVRDLDHWGRIDDALNEALGDRRRHEGRSLVREAVDAIMEGKRLAGENKRLEEYVKRLKDEVDRLRGMLDPCPRSRVAFTITGLP